MLNRIASSILRPITSERGSVAVQIGLGLSVLIGMAGLGTEGSFLLYKHRQMQSASDSAALSGAMALSQADPRDSESEARAVTAGLGFRHGAAQVTVTVNVPPASGAQAGNTDAVEVILSQPQDLLIMRLFGDAAVNVGTRSVALRRESGRFCVLALDPSAAQAMYISNNAVIPNPNCGVAVNSTSNSALYMRNNAAIDGPVTTRGGWDLANNAALNGSPLVQHGPFIGDPYANVQLQAPPPCPDKPGGSGSNNFIGPLPPGRYCNGWDFKNNVELTLEPGTYYIDSKLSMKNNVTVNVKEPGGVTLVINGNYAIDIGNNVTLNIDAPTSGDYAGLAFFGPRDGTPSVLQKFSNNTVMNIQGAVYFPSQTLEFDNNGATTAQGCTHVIGRMVRMMNNVELKNDCEATGVRPISPPAQLVE